MEIIQIKVDVAGAKQSLSQIQQVEKAVDSLAKKEKNVTVEINAKPLKDLKTEAEAAGNAGTVAAKKISDGMGSIEKSATDAGKSLSQLFSEITKWQILNAAVASTIRTFTNAVDTMQKVDDELVTVRKVTRASADELAKLKERAYETASAYGEAADEYLGFVSGFARAGYGKQAADLAELATKTKLVGDTNAETAQQFLLSVDAAYKYKGNIDALTKVLDGANEIDNKYATSIQAIAEGLGKVAPTAAMAGVGVDELTAALGTITAVTQRSGTEAATALRAIFLNILGDTTTEIEEGVTWTTGEIKGLMDVLKQFAPEVVKTAQATGQLIDPMEAIGALAKAAKEDTVTAAKIFNMINDIGGKLRTTQLVSLIENWDMYQSMLSDFGNAAGSADEEVSNALDSWTKKTKILQNEWTTLIENFLDTETVKTVLDGLIVAVDALDTDVGHAAITVGGLALAVQSVAGAASGLSKLTGLLGIGAANPWVLGVLAAGAAVTGLAYAVDKANPSLEEISAKLDDEAKQLEKNEDRLKEINAIPWNERTTEILTEKAALEQENEELRIQIGLQKELKQEKAKKQANQEVSVTTGREVKSWQLGTSYNSMEDAIGSIERIYGEGTKLSKWYIASLEEVDTTVKASGDALNNYLLKSLDEYNALIAKSSELTDNQIVGYNGTLDALKKQAEIYQVLKNSGIALTESQQAVLDAVLAFPIVADEAESSAEGLAEATEGAAAAAENAKDKYGSLAEMVDEVSARYNVLKTAQDETNKTGVISANTLSTILSKYPDLVGYLEQTEKGYKLTKGAVKDYIEAQKDECRVALADAKSAAESVVTQEVQKALGYDMTTEAIYEQIKAMQALAGTAGNDQLSGFKRTLRMKGVPESQINALFGGVSDFDAMKQMEARLAALNNIMVGGVSSTGKSTKDAELERLKDIVSLRKSELSLMQERGDSTANQIDKMRQIQAALHAQAEYMRRIGASQADINALSTEHWKITKQIEELQKDLWDELEDAVNKKLEEAADARDKQVDAIDKQIAALKDAKQAEDEALKLEQLKAAVLEKQNALLEAQKERTVRVFNAATGQWEWEANASSVKSAQDAYEKAKEDLAEYERELALQREIDELEAKKTLIEETYNTLKAEWKRITDSLQEPTRTIDDILSDIARNGTPKMRQQVDEVNNLLGKLNQYIAGVVNGGQIPGQPGEVPGVNGSAGVTGGYHFDYTKNPGGGWTQTEMNEGFIPAGSSGWKLADGSDANLNFKDTTFYGKGTKGKYTGPDTSRDEKLAGKTVEKNGYVITYDELGYVVSATNVHKGAARDDLSGIYTKVDANGNEMHYVGYDKNVDYNLAIKQAKEAGAGPGVIKQLETERQNKINAMYGGVDPNKGGKPSGGGSSSSKGNSSSGSSSSKNNSSGSSGKGYDSNVDYSLAIKNAEKNGASQATIDKLKSERQNKINDKYGGKDPYKKYDSGGILRGLGGIKATSQDEIVIPPLLAEKMLEPSADSTFQKRMSELGWLYGAAERGGAMPGKTVMSRTSYDHYGDSYSVNGVQIGAEAANRLTVAQIMQALNHGAGNLGLYKN